MKVKMETTDKRNSCFETIETITWRVMAHGPKTQGIVAPWVSYINSHKSINLEKRLYIQAPRQTESFSF